MEIESARQHDHGASRGDAGCEIPGGRRPARSGQHRPARRETASRAAGRPRPRQFTKSRNRCAPPFAARTGRVVGGSRVRPGRPGSRGECARRREHRPGQAASLGSTRACAAHHVVAVAKEPPPARPPPDSGAPRSGSPARRAARGGATASSRGRARGTALLPGGGVNAEAGASGGGFASDREAPRLVETEVARSGKRTGSVAAESQCGAGLDGNGCHRSRVRGGKLSSEDA